MNLSPPKRSHVQNFFSYFPWVLTLCLMALGSVGVLMLYSAGKGSWSPWAYNHAWRLSFGFIVLFIIAIIPLKWWLNLAYPAYICVLLLLIFVDIKGRIGMGAQRWIQLGPLSLQPSEFMKVALVLALARYYHGIDFRQIQKITSLIVPAILILIPALLIAKQPDLGTAVSLVAIGAIVVFLAGTKLRIFVIALLSGGIMVPMGWIFLLRGYQKRRIETFLNPQCSPPTDASYHICQSKIAIGSGSVFGQGFMQGSQSQLDFLPEKHTDFIFTMFAEEFGLRGGVVLFLLVFVIILITLATARKIKNPFGRLTCGGIGGMFSLYILLNTAMVMGLTPVVGIPFPLMSYGGTVILTVLGGFGLVASASIARYEKLKYD